MYAMSELLLNQSLISVEDEGQIKKAQTFKETIHEDQTTVNKLLKMYANWANTIDFHCLVC